MAEQHHILGDMEHEAAIMQEQDVLLVSKTNKKRYKPPP